MSALDLVSDEVLQQQLNVSRSTLWRLRQQGLPSRRVGRSIRYPLSEVQLWLKDHGISHESSNNEHLDLGNPGVGNSTQARLDLDIEVGDLPACHWSPAVAMDPKHRPQALDAPASTARKDWRKYPQEAHLLDLEGNRYRRLGEDEIAVIQGFPGDWAKGIGLTPRERIAGLGNAVPPPLGQAMYEAIAACLPERPQTAVEICAGFGGLALGAHRALRIRSLALVEYWEAAVRVLRSAGHWDPDTVHLGDVRDFEWGRLADRVDILSGGPPCQPWSQAGLSKGASDERDLLGEMPQLVAQVRPRAFLLENVPGLISPTHRAYLEWIVRQLKSAGGDGSYGVAVGVVQAADYGVPQTRKRVIIAGIRGQSDGAVHDFFDRLYALRTHSNPSKALPRNLRPWITIRSALPEWANESGWHRWLGTKRSAVEMESSKSTARGAVDRDNEAHRASVRKAPSMGLVWPGRDHAIAWSGEHWRVHDVPDGFTSSVPPLLRENSEGRPLEDPWYVVGDHVESLEALRAAVGRIAKLVYFEPPRLDTDLVSFAAQDSRSRLNTWLTLNQASIRRAASLISDEGVIAVLTGVAEQPYLQVMLDEIFGPENRVGTVVWQKGYSVQGQDKDKPKQEIYPTHDYILIYSRRREECLPGAALKGPPKNFAHPDGDPRGPWKAEQKGANYRRDSSDFSVNLPPYRWEVVGGNLPPWFWRISPKTGVIWGKGDKITEPGAWKIRVRVTDKAGTRVEKDFVIRVQAEGEAPAPAAPGWLIARDGDGKPTNGDSPANLPPAGGKLRIETASLPIGRVGKHYYACVDARGGQPWGGTTRPGKSSETGKSRYWDVSFESLELAAAEDAVDFKSQDDSIPAIKVFLDGASFTYINQISTWRGEGRGKIKGGLKDPMRVGWGQDAKKELEMLLAAGIVESVINIGKPAGLMARITALFTGEDDLVVDIGSPTAEMASVASQLRRRVVYVESPGTDSDRAAIRLPRLRAAARGVHPIPDGVLFFENEGEVPEEGYYVGHRPRDKQESGDVCVFKLGKPLLKAALPVIDYVEYAAGSPKFLQALSSLEGLVWIQGDGGAFARSHDGKIIALHLAGDHVLDGRSLM